MAYFGIAGSLQSSVTSANTKNIDAPGRAHVYIYITHAGFATERSRSRCPPSLHKQHNVTCFYASPGNIFWKAISHAHARFQKSIHFRQYSRHVDVACYLGWKRSACQATRTQHPVTVHIVCHCMYTCTATDWNPENIWEHLRTLGMPRYSNGTPSSNINKSLQHATKARSWQSSLSIPRRYVQCVDHVWSHINTWSNMKFIFDH